MGKRSAEVDRYIENAQPFARPILKRIRKAYHQAEPNIQEAMKWSFPHFEYKGIVGSMSAFKEHVNYGFWKAKLMKDPEGILSPGTIMAGSRLKQVSDLPPDDVLIAYIREAVRLNEENVKVERPPARKRGAPVKIPPTLAAALKKNKKAGAAFKKFSPSQQREYAEWIGEAKQDATREKRLATAMEWIAEGKPRNWKYQKR